MKGAYGARRETSALSRPVKRKKLTATHFQHPYYFRAAAFMVPLHVYTLTLWHFTHLTMFNHPSVSAVISKTFDISKMIPGPTVTCEAWHLLARKRAPTGSLSPIGWQAGARRCHFLWNTTDHLSPNVTSCWSREFQLLFSSLATFRKSPSSRRNEASCTENNPYGVVLIFIVRVWTVYTREV